MVATFEESVAKAMQQGQFKDTSFIDKILGKEDIEEIKLIMMKNRLSRSDMLRLLYLMTSTESKLHNFGERERYVLLKFFVWVREFVRQCEGIFDYEDMIAEQKKGGKPFKLTEVAEKLLDNNRRHLEHDVKFLVDLFLMIARTSMSLGAAGFKEILINKFEMLYDQKNTISTTEATKK